LCSVERGPNDPESNTSFAITFTSISSRKAFLAHQQIRGARLV